MAGPLFAGIGGLAASASAASLSPALPTPHTNGNGIYIAVVASKNNATHSTATGGWTQIAQTNSGASFTASIWIAAQGASAPTFTWTGAAACHAQIIYYTDPQNTMAASVSVTGTTGTGTTATHTSTGFTSDANTVLAIYADACAVSTSLATPAGWTEDFDNGSATSGSRQVFGSKSIATSGTGSGNISVSGGAAAWVQFQIEVKGSTPTAGLQVSKVGLSAWAEPSGLAVSKATVEAWLETNDARFSKVELAAWLDPSNASRRRMILM